MNNSFLNLEEVIQQDNKPVLRQRETEIIKIIEAITALIGSDEWNTLKSLIFDGLVASLEKRQKAEISNKPIDTDELHRLHGQLIWAKRYSDLNKLLDVYKLELTTIRKRINA